MAIKPMGNFCSIRKKEGALTLKLTSRAVTITEAAAILAGGIVRLRRREVERIRRSRLFSGDGLDLFLEKSVHCNNKELPKGESR